MTLLVEAAATGCSGAVGPFLISLCHLRSPLSARRIIGAACLSYTLEAKGRHVPTST
ncbi:hypothetical protein [Hymenobacter volaticus]|uniref:Uncharacterized protein n=1 Tax=Hymenobacter volaticus TaxID=2932254 RepID=A0ABY4GF01_9BACT|nr:hypothetical protein [Hymenobacter volaticus]UOQ69508.1 hypothetical protein MUN86_28100 [Hymenobacter volaticus]